MQKPLAGRDVTNAADLRGPRIYSTDLLPTFLDPADIDGSVENAARALKVKIITKGLVTLNGGHLMSPMGVHLLERNEDLLDGDALLPAFRDTIDSFEDLAATVGGHAAAGIDASRLGDHVQSIEAKLRRAMPWSLGNVGERFRKVLTDGLANPDSAVSLQVAGVGKDAAWRDQAVAHLAVMPFDHSEAVRDYVDTLAEPEAVKEALRRFVAASYHAVGTGVVNSEAGADLSPLSHFREADLLLARQAVEDRKLSDEAIFLDMFMSYALETINASAMPTWIIDGIDFATAHSLGGALREAGFAARYDEIVRDWLSLSGLLAAGDSLERFDARAVAWAAEDLRKAFRQAILNELPDYRTKAVLDARSGVLQNRTEVVRGVFTEVIPGLSNIVSFASWMKKGVKLIREEADLAEINDGFAAARLAQAEEIEKVIARLRDTKSKATFLEAVRAMSQIQGIATAAA